MCSLLLFSTTLQAAGMADDDEPGIKSAGDVLQWALPALGYGLTYWFKDDDANRFRDAGLSDKGESLAAAGLNWPGPRLNASPKHDFLVSFLRMETTVYALKFTVHAQRPNGQPHSFPSGHTASAFMGAEFVRKNYGLAWGIPAYGAAALVGYSRVESRNHYWRDVLAGAMIGIAANHDFDAVQTPLGQLSFGASLTPNQQMNDTCEATLTCFNAGMSRSNNKLALLPGIQLHLRF